MSKIYLVSAKRSAIGTMLGTLKDTTPTELGAKVLKATLEAGGVDPSWLDEVIVGNVLPAGIKQGPARQVAIGAGVPVEIPAYSLNMVCGSGMKAVMNAVMSIKAGINNLVAAGGTEVMSGAPYLVSGKVRSGNKMGEMKLVDHMLVDSLTDAFAISSQQKAIVAQDNGKFVDEIVPITVKAGRKEIVFDQDEYINRTTTLEKLGTLRTAFKADGTVTAGNASGINDGASFVIVASEEAVAKYGLKPMAEIVGIGQGGVEPDVMGLGPVPAIRNALKNAGMKLDEMEVLELNEAFAAQSLGVVHLLSQEHGVDKETIMSRCNVNGGAIALGHPVGASGNRIIVTLAHELKHSGKTYGLASLCIGGGMGTAVVLKNIK